MHTEGRILKNTAVLGAGEAIGQLAGFVFIIVCGRLYGVDGLGWYSLAMAVGAIAVVLASAGTHGLLLRDLAQRPEESSARISGTLPYEAGLAALIWVVIVAATSALIADPLGRWIVVLVAAHHLILSVAALRLIPSRARQIMWPSACLGAADRLLILVIVTPLAVLGLSAESAFLTFPLVAVVILGAVLAANRRLADPVTWQPNSFSRQSDLYAAALPFFNLAVVNALWARAGVFMIAALLGEESVGLYAAGDRILVVFGVLQILFVGALAPAVASLARTDRRRSLEVASRCMRMLLVLTIPAAGLLAIFHREVVAAMFGEGFEDSAVVLLVLAPAFVIKGVNSLRASQAMAIGLQAAVARLRLLALAVFVVFGLVGIRLAGPAGLAAAVVLVEIGYTAALRTRLAREAFLAAALPLAWKPAAAVLAAAAVYWSLGGLGAQLQAACVVASMLVVLFGLGAVRAHDLRYLRAVLSPRPAP